VRKPVSSKYGIRVLHSAEIEVYQNRVRVLAGSRTRKLYETTTQFGQLYMTDEYN
jgi:hypothetical protein